MRKNRAFIGTRVRKVPHTPDVQQPRKPVGFDRGDKRTLQQALALFIRAKESESVRPSTIREYRRHIEYLSDYMINVEGYQNAFVDDLSEDIVRSYITYLLTEKRRYMSPKGRTGGRKDTSKGLSANTVNIRLRTLRTMCRYWKSAGIIADNPMSEIKNVLTDNEEEVPGLSDAEVSAILNSYDEVQFAEWRDKILCLLLLDTGLRINEAVGLTLERIDFITYTLLVPSEVAKNRRFREVPISREVAELLKELYDESSHYFGEIEHIFYNAYGEPYNADAFRKRLNRLKGKLGMKRLSPHQFRHTFARSYLLNGGDLFTLQKILDHADINTTRKYVQMDLEHVRSQHNKYSPIRRIYERRQ